LRVFQRLRRRRTCQQACRKRELCQHRDDLLSPDQDARNRSRVRCAGASAGRGDLARSCFWHPNPRMSSVALEDRMNKTFRRFTWFAIIAAMRGSLIGLALAQANPPPSAAGGQPRQYAAPGSAPSSVPPAGTEPAIASELPVLYVTSVEVLRTSTEPKLDIVRVTGLASSQGWNAPQLVPTFW